MANTLRLQEVSLIKSNITSSIDISPTEKYFTAVTRSLSTGSSMFTYQLDLYELKALQKINSTDIYESYSEQKHFCKFLADDKTIVVTTKYHIIFYDVDMSVKFRALHNLENIYDLASSPNGRLVAVVGDNKLLLWDAATFRTIKFTPSLPQARICKFSPDGSHFVVSFTQNDQGTLSFYSILLDQGQFYFQLSDQVGVDIAYGFISSVDFNPHSGSQIVVGFSNVSPRTYDLSNPQAGFKPLYNLGEQPYYKDNYKQAVFMPDGKRVISSDYKNGVGLWPANPDDNLIYKQDYFFFGLIPFDKGRKVIGYVWQRIKVIEVQFKCPANTIEDEAGGKKSYTTSCSCPSGSYWDTAEYRCSSCNQNGFNICQCPAGETFQADLATCVYNCSSVQYSVSSANPLVSLADGARCFCQPGYQWLNGRCVFDCFKISQYAIAQTSPSVCLCADPLVWNNMSKICECPLDTVFNRNSQPECECDAYHYRSPNTGKCVPDCTKAEVNADTFITFQESDTCPCRKNMIFKRYELPGSGLVSEGCISNCDAIDYTIEGTPPVGCKCPQNMKWEDNKCKIDCSKIENAVGDIIDPETGQISCRCPTNYLWVPKNLQCGKDCSAVQYSNSSLQSTAISCPCINTFIWDPLNNKCVIDCEQVNFSESYSIKNTYSCVCRQTFYWDPKIYGCMINCSKIWDALPNRVGPGQCKCNNNRQFNSTGLLCHNQDETKAVFQKPWVWAILIIGIIFVIIVFAIMFKYCKKFASERAQDKKLKKSPEKKKRKKLKPKDPAATTTERLSLNRE